MLTLAGALLHVPWKGFELPEDNSGFVPERERRLRL